MQNQQKVKAFELRKQDETILVQTLNRFRAELVSLRTSKVSSAPQVKLARIRVSKCFQRIQQLRAYLLVKALQLAKYAYTLLS
jgi:ribosomal protein L29